MRKNYHIELSPVATKSKLSFKGDVFSSSAKGCIQILGGLDKGAYYKVI